ncbi:PhzF family phenazine biosynthesis protein [Maledivibacter halophilus]|uniref:Phenazine biosynthesis protein PhzF family n=1 Tax=Maledivibacter halophilus TaxID=36842 RepID=A0A1T5ML09_9FIRM|nr:PhzF family phenazine biosynthesis protein [Maledivibacter halophilus]SKC88910.1 phenazine biosynthesis protein PhzF family [Maledivibacter halophilus]
MEKIIYQVDSFTDTVFGGNPAGVVLDTEGLDKNKMINISKEMALSETAFVKKVNGKEFDYEIRFFTPTEEIELCGHATIAAFFVLAKEGLIESVDEKIVVKQKTLAGVLPVEIYFKENKVEKIMMTQKRPEFIFDVGNVDEIANIMGLNICDVGLEKFEILPMAYSTGLVDIIFPVKNIDTLKKVKPDFEKLKNYSIKHNVVGVHAFTFKDYDRRIVSCRNFAPAFGINEEAATGTSNGALAAYLINNDIINIKQKVDIICQQGYFMKRPSQIHVEINKDSEGLIVKVGGRAVLAMKGKIYL